jgi:hypothetical protein
MWPEYVPNGYDEVNLLAAANAKRIGGVTLEGRTGPGGVRGGGLDRLLVRRGQIFFFPS